MIVIEFLKTYEHTERRTWHTGDRPTVTRELGMQLILTGYAIYIKEGCGCPEK